VLDGFEQEVDPAGDPFGIFPGNRFRSCTCCGEDRRHRTADGAFPAPEDGPSPETDTGSCPKKQEEAKAAIAKEKDDKKKAEIYQTKQNEAAVEEQKLMAPLLKDVDLAIHSVAKAKGLTLVIDVAQALMGGVDITHDVIAELKKNS